MKDNKVFDCLEASRLFYKNLLSENSEIGIREYLDSSYCDEIIEFDLLNDSVNHLYHVENKFYLPVISSVYSDAYHFFLDNCIHPDDQKIVKDLLNPSKLENYLDKSDTPNFIFRHFRLKISDGSYRYVEMAILSGKENNFNEGVGRFYIFDIHNSKCRELGLSNDESYIELERDRDVVSNLYNRTAFYKRSDELIAKYPSNDYIVIAFEIENLKLFDEWHGRAKADQLTAQVANVLLKATNNHKDGVAGTIVSNEFCLIIRGGPNKVEELFDSIREVTKAFGLSAGFMPIFGVSYLRDAVDVKDAFKKALIAKENAKKKEQNYIVYYDPKYRKQTEEEYKLFLEVMDALKNGAITFYLQPQCRLSTGKVVGAEALARWKKEDGAFISPSIFVPILEKYGFIIDLDQFIWERVVQYIRHLLDLNITPVPISINVSRKDIMMVDVATCFIDLTKKYNVDHKYVKIEITESAYVDNNLMTTELVQRLNEAGFQVLMDDFGSGYSSLNMLSTTKVDAIKLDSGFLDLKESAFNKGIHILESVVSMAKIISMPIILEGVETKEQCEFLENIGVRYVQGYYLYKPLSKQDFQDLIKDDNKVDREGIIAKLNEQFRLREFLDTTVYSDAMLNSILGPVAIYTYNKGKVDIVRFNEQFYESVSDSAFFNRLTSIEQYVSPKYKDKFNNLFINAKENRLNGSNDIIRFIKRDNSVTSFLMKMYYIGSDSNGVDRFYGSASNVTKMAELEGKMRLIATYSSDTIILLKWREGHWIFDVVVHGLNNATGISKKDLSQELSDGSFFIKRLRKEESDRMRENLMRMIQTKKIVYNDDFHFMNDEGKEIHIYLRSDPVLEEVYNIEYILNFRLFSELDK